MRHLAVECVSMKVNSIRTAFEIPKKRVFCRVNRKLSRDFIRNGRVNLLTNMLHTQTQRNVLFDLRKLLKCETDLKCNDH